MQFNIFFLKFISIFILIEAYFTKNLNNLKNKIEKKSNNEIHLLNKLNILKNNTNSNRQSGIEAKLTDLKNNLIDTDFTRKFSCFHVTPDFSAYDLAPLDNTK